MQMIFHERFRLSKMDDMVLGFLLGTFVLVPVLVVLYIWLGLFWVYWQLCFLLGLPDEDPNGVEWR